MSMVVLHRGDFNLSNFQDGVLSSAFMVGLLVASPIFASVAKRCVILVSAQSSEYKRIIFLSTLNVQSH